MSPQVNMSIPEWVASHPRFPQLTACGFLDKVKKLKKVGWSSVPALLQLGLLKDSMWEASGELQMAPPSGSKINKEDKVGVVLGLLRAVERRHPNGIRKWAERLPDFDGAINYKDPDTWSETNKRKLRQLAHQLAKDQVVEELR